MSTITILLLSAEDDWQYLLNKLLQRNHLTIYGITKTENETFELLKKSEALPTVIIVDNQLPSFDIAHFLVQLYESITPFFNIPVLYLNRKQILELSLSEKMGRFKEELHHIAVYQAKIRAQTASSLAKTEPLSVLIVNDNKHLLEDMADCFYLEDYDLFGKAENGVEALSLLDVSDTKPSIIILDQYMPQMDGMQLFQELQQSDTYKTIPILMLLVRGDRDFHRTLKNKPHVDYLYVPFDAKELLDIADRLVNRRGYYTSYSS